MGTMNLEHHVYGLDDPKLVHIHELLHDYDRNLSLRRIRPDDPVLNFTRMNAGPPHEFGVWEENVAPGQRNWAFTLPAMSVDERVLARVIENDMLRNGASERMARLQAFESAKEASRMKRELERRQERREEMEFIGRQSEYKSQFKHKFKDGRTLIVGGDNGLREPSTTVPQNKRLKEVKPRA